MVGCADWLRTVRPTLSVNADTAEPEGSNDAVEGGLRENEIEFPRLNSQIVAPSLASTSRSLSGCFKSRVGLFSGMSLVACTLGQL